MVTGLRGSRPWIVAVLGANGSTRTGYFSRGLRMGWSKVDWRRSGMGNFWCIVVFFIEMMGCISPRFGSAPRREMQTDKAGAGRLRRVKLYRDDGTSIIYWRVDIECPA